MNEVSTSALLGTWLGVFLTLCVLSFLYKDNPFYRLAEHLFVGVSTGYVTVRQFFDTLLPNLIAPLLSGLSGRAFFPQAYVSWWPIHFVGAAFCVLMFARYSKRFSYLSRWPLALVVGAFAGINIVGYASGDLVQQIDASMVSLDAPVAVAIERVIVTIGFITTLLYFFFSKAHTGALGVAAKVGIWFMMIAFGASFGYTAMGRVALLFRRAQYLRNEDGPGGAWPVGVLAVGMIGALLVWERRRRREAGKTS